MKKIFLSCVALGVVASCYGGMVVVPKVVASQVSAQQEHLGKMISPIIEMKDTKELETFLKGAVKFPQYLPNQLKRKSLQKIRLQERLIYEVDYVGETNTFALRIADKSAKEISGDYREATDIKKVKVGGKKVTLKGDKEGILQAKWTKEGKQFVLIAEKPATPSTVKALIRAF